MGVLDGLGAFSRVGGWEWGLEWYGISVFGVVGGENCLSDSQLLSNVYTFWLG